MQVCLFYNTVVDTDCLCACILRIQRDENCLFRAQSYCMYNTEGESEGKAF